MLIKLWEWEKWTCVQVFEGHSHYVMQVTFNPKDNNQFASSSLDKTVKVHFFLSSVCSISGVLLQVLWYGSPLPFSIPFGLSFPILTHSEFYICIQSFKSQRPTLDNASQPPPIYLTNAQPIHTTNARCACTCSQVWQLGCAQAAFTLEGHEKGVNCIDYYTGGDKPYLISGADDRMVKVWDYQVRLPLLCLPLLRYVIQYK